MPMLRLLALLGSLGGAGLLNAAEPAFRFPAGTLGKSGELAYVNDVPVLTVSGSPAEIGAAIGTLAVKPAPRILRYPRDLLARAGASAAYPFFAQAGAGMFKQFPADYRTELDAIARASAVDRDTLIVGNTLFDLHRVFLCSAVLVESARSATGGPLLARNLDYPSLGYVHEYTLVTVYRPRGKHAFASVGFPGIQGCLSGMNDAGLSLAVLEVMGTKPTEPSFDAGGVPYALCQRRLLEECTTIDEAQKLLTSFRRTTMTNLVVADRQGVAVLEVTPGQVVRREAVAGIAPCTNHFCTSALRPEKPVDPQRSRSRFDKLAQLRTNEIRLTPELLREQLDAVNLGPLTLQTMVFEPATLRLHLAHGSVPASSGKLHTIDLAPLLR